MTRSVHCIRRLKFVFRSLHHAAVRITSCSSSHTAPSRLVPLCVGVTLCLLPRTAHAQQWRTDASHLGTSTRVLLVGTRPDDEDNALLLWLRRARHIETAYLSITRGEAGRNVAGAERTAPLAVVRTAELLAEREQDGARQFFTRAFDVGVTPYDRVVEKAWPRDSVLRDVTAIIRAFRPHVVIVLADTTDREDATQRFTARLVASAYTLAADTTLLPSALTARIPAWSAARLFTLVDSVADPARVMTRIDVGEFDRATGRSYAESGAELRRLQRTQPAQPGAALGPMLRRLRLDSTRVGNDASLFGALDTSLARVRSAVPAEAASHFDSLHATITQLARDANRLDADSLTPLLAAVTAHTATVRRELQCRDEAGVPTCEGMSGDLAVVLGTMHRRAVHAFIGAAGVVIDAVAERETVAAGDSVNVSVTIHNGGNHGVTLRRLALAAQQRLTLVYADTNIVVPAGRVVRVMAPVRMLSPTYHWWQINGMVPETMLQRLTTSPRLTIAPQLLMGEDRVAHSGVEATLQVAGRDVPLIVNPIVHRSATALRGDMRHPLIGVPETSLLFERGAEYERAGQAVDRLFRVFVQSARSSADTVAVTLELPPGVLADSLTRTVALPPFSARNLFFRLRGALIEGSQTISATARSVAAVPAAPGSTSMTLPKQFTLGTVLNEYPHIPTQHFVRFAKDRVESVELRLPPRFRIGYMRGTEDLRSAFAQLRLAVQSLDLALVPVADLSSLSGIVIGTGALRSESALLAAPALRAFMARGGVVLVLAGGPELARSGLFPVPIDIRDVRIGRDRNYTELTLVDEQSPFFRTPNRITVDDFSAWAGDRACAQFASISQNWSAPLLMADAGRNGVQPALVTAPVGKGRITFTPLCLAQQLEAAHAAAPKLLVNLLTPSALRPIPTRPPAR